MVFPSLPVGGGANQPFEYGARFVKSAVGCSSNCSVKCSANCAADSGGNAAKPAVGSADSGGAKTPAQASDLSPDSVHNEAGAPDIAELPSAL